MAYTRIKRQCGAFRKYQNIGLLALMGMTICAGAYAFVPKSSLTSPEPEATTSPPVPTDEDPTHTDFGFSAFADAAESFRSQDDDFVLTIVGDSTGFADEGWVAVAVEDILASTGYKLVVHNWDADNHRYGTYVEFGDGPKTLTVWNGSAPSTAPGYSSSNIDTIIPTESDLIVVNIGHNYQTPTYATNGMRKVLEDIAELSVNKPAVAVMLQNPEIGKHSDSHSAIVRHLSDATSRYNNIKIIDTYSAFTDAGEMKKLVSRDGIHPTEAGYRLWSELFLNELGLEKL